MQTIVVPHVRRKFPWLTVTQYGLLILLIALVLVPVWMMASMSLRTTARIYAQYWSLPIPATLANYKTTLLDLWPALMRTMYVAVASIFGTLAIAAPCAYAHARSTFPGKRLFFGVVLLAMMVPGVLLLTPRFILADQLHLRNSLEGLILYYIAGNQAFAVFLMTSYFKTQSEEIFSAARIDGASEFRAFIGIALPLAAPILATIAIMNFLGIYSDFIWPLLMLPSSMYTLMPALEQYNPQVSEMISRPDLGAQTAGYVFATAPQLVIIGLGMRYFVQGLTSGAVKA